jgi:hypothetical protein
MCGGGKKNPSTFEMFRNEVVERGAPEVQMFTYQRVNSLKKIFTAKYITEQRNVDTIS